MSIGTTLCGSSVLLRLVILVGGALLALVGSDLIHLKVTLPYIPLTINVSNLGFA